MFEFDDPLDQWIWDHASEYGYDTTALTTGSIANDFVNFAKRYIYNPDTGEVNYAGIATGLAAAYSLFGGGNDIQQTGWSEPPPKLDATRQQVVYNDPNRQPGEYGRRYFTDVQYTPQGDASAAQTAATEQAQGLAALRPAAVPKTNPYAGTFKTPWEKSATTAPAPPLVARDYPAVPSPQQLNEKGGLPEEGYQMARGGLVKDAFRDVINQPRGPVAKVAPMGISTLVAKPEPQPVAQIEQVQPQIEQASAATTPSPVMEMASSGTPPMALESAPTSVDAQPTEEQIVQEIIQSSSQPPQMDGAAVAATSTPTMEMTGQETETPPATPDVNALAEEIVSSARQFPSQPPVPSTPVAEAKPTTAPPAASPASQPAAQYRDVAPTGDLANWSWRAGYGKTPTAESAMAYLNAIDKYRPMPTPSDGSRPKMSTLISNYIKAVDSGNRALATALETRARLQGMAGNDFMNVIRAIDPGFEDRTYSKYYDPAAGITGGPSTNLSSWFMQHRPEDWSGIVEMAKRYNMTPENVAFALGISADEARAQMQGAGFAQGGMVPSFKGNLESGGFVIPGDVVRHADPMGSANKERGLAALHQTMGAQAIRGPGDAMSDSIPTSIDGKQPAAVANGEAYVPRQAVEAIGGGDQKRGADKLYDMMEKLRLDRTGSKKQINPDNPQELVRAYKGGSVAKFEGGGDVPQPVSYGQSTMNTLSPYIGEYVTSALGKGAAMAATPYQAYTGPLTAGPSDLQQQAFAGIQSIAGAGYTPETYSYQTGQFGGETAQRYMNPYLQSALDPQLQEMRRQADIARLDDAARLTKAGAFGGSRQAIMESEGRRNLMDTQRKALGEGYMTAYDKALQQYNLEQGKQIEAQGLGEKSRQYSAEYGLKSLADMAGLGQTQRDIEKEGVAADKAQFEEERQYAYAQPAYQLGLLSGIPIGGTTTTPNQTGISAMQSQLADLLGIYRSVSGATGG